MTAKEQILSTVNEWASKHIDTITASNPRMSLLAPRIKQGMENFIAQNDKKLDNALLFFTDKEGKLDVGDMFEEGMKMFEEMPLDTKRIMGMDLNYGRGVIELKMPDNFFVNMFMGNTGSVKLTTADFMELKQMLTAKTV